MDETDDYLAEQVDAAFDDFVVELEADAVMRGVWRGVLIGSGMWLGLFACWHYAGAATTSSALLITGILAAWVLIFHNK